MRPNLKQQTLTNNGTKRRLVTTEVAVDVIVKTFKSLGYDRNTIKLIVAQWMHESGQSLTSYLAITNNNFGGMRSPYGRKNYAVGVDGSNYAIYNCIEDYCKDMSEYRKNWKCKSTYKSVDEYVTELKNNGYFEDAYLTYFKSMTSIYNNNPLIQKI